jgi:hypothetical protein
MIMMAPKKWKNCRMNGSLTLFFEGVVLSLVIGIGDSAGWLHKMSKAKMVVLPKTETKALYVRVIPKPVRSVYRRVVPRFLRVFLRERSLKFWALLFSYVVGQLVCNRLRFGVVFFICSLILFIFLNLGRNGREKGVMSAYSVFNAGNRRLAGEYDPSEMDRMLRQGGIINQ